MKPVREQTLEQRGAAALKPDAIGTSADLGALIEEVEAGIAKADQTAAIEKERAFDPALSPDPQLARQRMEDATFAANRLRTLLPRLQQKIVEVSRAERAARWSADADQVEVKVEAAAKKLARYPELVAELVAIFQEVIEVDREVGHINFTAPDGEHRRLNKVELVARGLERLTVNQPSILENCQLPDWEHSDRKVWPPQQPPLGVLVAASMVFANDGRYGPNWFEANKARRAEIERDQQRLADYYDQQNDEARRRYLEQQQRSR
jgi:hypothetical protein